MIVIHPPAVRRELQLDEWQNQDEAYILILKT